VFTEPFYYSDVVAYVAGWSDAAKWEDLNVEGVNVGVPQASSHVKFVARCDLDQPIARSRVLSFGVRFEPRGTSARVSELRRRMFDRFGLQGDSHQANLMRSRAGS